MKFQLLSFALLMSLFSQGLAQEPPSLLFKIPSQGLACCRLSESKFDKEILAYAPRENHIKHLENILSYTGLQPNFVFAQSPSIGNNAIALINGRQRIILYSETFLDALASKTKTDFSSVAVLAHEIGHHLQGHTLDNKGSTPKTELEADRFSGYVLARMGAQLEQATAAVEKISSENGSATHPPRYARVAAITDGWKRAQEHLKLQLSAAALEPSEATYLRIGQTATESSPGTWKWTAWIDADAASLAAIQSVTWKLHELLPDPTRQSTNKASNFEISESSKGTFPLKADLLLNGGETKNLRAQLEFKNP